MASGILVPWPGLEPMPLALGARSFNHLTPREASIFYIFKPRPLLTQCEGKTSGKAIACDVNNQSSPASKFVVFISGEGCTRSGEGTIMVSIRWQLSPPLQNENSFLSVLQKCHQTCPIPIKNVINPAQILLIVKLKYILTLRPSH